MAQITSGLRSILSYPKIYNGLQKVAGADGWRREFVKDFVRPMGGHRILDIGCGTGELLACFPPYVTYVGYDPSIEYIAYAKRRHYDDSHFHCGFFDRHEAALHPPFDTIIAIGVLHHMDDDQVTEMMALARHSMVQGGRLVTIDPVFCERQSLIARLLISMDRGQSVRTEEEYVRLGGTVFPDVKGLVRHRAWVPWTHWIMECRA